MLIKITTRKLFHYFYKGPANLSWTQACILSKKIFFFILTLGYNNNSWQKILELLGLNRRNQGRIFLSWSAKPKGGYSVLHIFGYLWKKKKKKINTLQLFSGICQIFNIVYFLFLLFQIPSFNFNNPTLNFKILTK